MKKWILPLLAATLLAGCARSAPVATPMPATPTPAQAVVSAPTRVVKPTPSRATPTAAALQPTATSVAPAPTSSPVDQSAIQCATSDSDAVPPEIDEIIESLGYAYGPTALPKNFNLADVSFDRSAVRQTYQHESEYKNIIVAYPIEFSPDKVSGPLGWERPADAVSALRLGNQTAYIMTGGWSDASIIAGPALNPKDAVWDYDKSLALFFTCRSEGGQTVDMAIQALPGPMDWIAIGEIVDVAHSLRRVSGSR